MIIRYLDFLKLSFCQWSFNFIELCSETAIYVNLKLVKTYIMAQHIVTSDKYFICAWKDYFLPLGINFTFIYKVELSPVFSDLIYSYQCCFVYVIYQLLSRGVFTLTLLVDCTISPHSYSDFRFLYFKAVFLGVFKFRIAMCVSGSVVSSSLWPPWTVACQAPLSVEFSRPEYWSR